MKKKIEDIIQRYNAYYENDDDEEDNDNIHDDIEDIIKEYNRISDEAYDNAKYYYNVIIILYWDYRENYWKSGIGRIYDKTTKAIIILLNKNYIYYENKFNVFIDKLKDLNLKLINKN